MRIAVIADDLTGANDAGVKFAGKGMKTAVFLQPDSGAMADYDAVVIDTDSRSAAAEEAYGLVRTGAGILRRENFDIYFKKIDSTMRGHVGTEFDAIFDELAPRFLFFTPAFPAHHRFVKDGHLYVGDRLLHETEFAQDPISPMRDSYIPNIVESKSRRKVGRVTPQECSSDPDRLLIKLNRFLEENRTLILFDAVTDDDLKGIAEWGRRLPFPVVWAGSAGLAAVMTPETAKPDTTLFSPSERPVLVVVGSVNPKTRSQVAILAAQPNIACIRLDSPEAVAQLSLSQAEKQRILNESDIAVRNNRDILLFSSGDSDDVERAQRMGADLGLSQSAASDRIAEAIGMAAAAVIQHYGIERVILTGGDTAKRVCHHAGITKFEPAGEVEPGIPCGKWIGRSGSTLYGITKAGGFGSERSLVRSLAMLKGDGER